MLTAVAAVAAIVAAVGPAVAHRSVYTWPPDALPGTQPRSTWYTPLALTQRVPARLELDLPCSFEHLLPDASRPPIVFATARHPKAIDGLSIELGTRMLTLLAGGTEFADIPLPHPSAGCGLQLVIAGADWSVGGPNGELGAGTLPAPVTVTGLFSQLDLRASPGLHAQVTTQVYGSHQRVRQRLAGLIAILSAITALIIATGVDRSRPRLSVRRTMRALRAEDAVVLGTLGAWWIVAPASFDDGWVKVRQDAFAYLDGFANYYDTFATTLPLGYWLEWLQRIVVARSDALVLQRLPTFAAIVGCWFLCRAVLGGLSRGLPHAWAARLVLAPAFLACATAWLMTLRPEPFTALTVGVSLLCAVRFADRPSAGPLAVASLAIVLGLTAHSSGIAAVAPVVAVSPAILAWLRQRGRPAVLTTAVTITAAASVLAVLATLGADVSRRRADADVYRAVNHNALGVLDEFFRYDHLYDDGTSVQRLAGGLALLAILAYLLRGQRTPSPLDVAARSLVAALVLFSFTPSKWMTHFGAVAVITAVAVATETQRLLRDGLRPPLRWAVRPFLAIVAVLVLASWAWSSRLHWSGIDLRTETWLWRFERVLPLDRLTVLLAALAVAAVAVFAARRRGRDVRAAPWLAVPLVVAVTVVPIFGLTVMRFAEDMRSTQGWTLARQNLDALRGRRACGLADDALIPDTRSATRLIPIAGAGSGAVEPGDELGPGGVSTFSSPGTPTVTPWFDARRARRVGLYLRGFPSAPDHVIVEWGRPTTNGVEVLAGGGLRLTPRTDLADDRLGIPFLAWQFAPSAKLPARPAEAELVRVRLAGYPEPGPVVTAPLAYDTISISRALAEGGSALVTPQFRTYFPCVRDPSIAGGVHAVPDWMVLLPTRNLGLFPIGARTSSSFGMLDLYELDDLPTDDSEHTTAGLRVFRVNGEIPGAAVAPAQGE